MFCPLLPLVIVFVVLLSCIFNGILCSVVDFLHSFCGILVCFWFGGGCCSLDWVPCMCPRFGEQRCMLVASHFLFFLCVGESAKALFVFAMHTKGFCLGPCFLLDQSTFSQETCKAFNQAWRLRDAATREKSLKYLANEEQRVKAGIFKQEGLFFFFLFGDVWCVF